MRGSTSLTSSNCFACARGISSRTLAEAVKAANEKIEKIMIVSRLADMNGNRSATADSLGISRKTLFNKMRQYALSDDDADVD